MRKWSRFKEGGFAAVVATVLLVPLYGDPHATPVTHAEWARMLLRALSMDLVLEMSTQASQAFGILSWRDGLVYKADRYQRADGVETVTAEDGTRSLVANGSKPGEVAYPIAVILGGNYQFRVKLRGNPSVTAAAEITKVGDTKPAGTFTIVPASVTNWVQAGRAHLDPGPYTASVMLPPGAALERIELVPPCLTAIEPPKGWRAAAIATTGDVAVTVLKAVDQESELAPAATPIEVSAADFQVTQGTPAPLNVGLDSGLEGRWLRAGPGGLEAMVYVDIPEAGVYSVSTFSLEGGGQAWLGDACRKSVICPKGNRTPGWHTIMTAEFTAGPHAFTVTFADGSGVSRLRVEQKKASPSDYEAAVKRLGLDLGPSGEISRQKAVEAMRFVEGRHGLVLGATCGDITAPTEATLEAHNGEGGGGPLPGPPGGVIPGQPGGFPGTGPPIGPPVIPPQQPASPVLP